MKMKCTLLKGNYEQANERAKRDYQMVKIGKPVMKKKTKDTNHIDYIIGNNINQYRIAMGVTREALAKAIGITHQQVQKYEKGVNRVTVSRLLDIAEALEVSYVSLIASEKYHNINYPRASLELMRHFNKLDEDKRGILLRLAKAFAGLKGG